MKEFDSDKDYYDILGVDENATSEEIEKAFRQQARKLHPDSGGTEEAMKALNEAHSILKDHGIRSAYDETRGIQNGVRKPWDASAVNHAENRHSPPHAGYSEEDFLGRLISSLVFLGGGLIFFLVVEANWVFFLWPLRLLALFIVTLSVYWSYAAFKLKQRRLKSGAYRKLAEAVFWLAICGGGILVTLFLIVVHGSKR